MNAVIGEKTLVLGGKSYVLRPSFKAMCQIESHTGKSILTLIKEFGAGKPFMSDMVAVAYFCHAASDYEPGSLPTIDRFGELMMKEGMFTVGPQVLECLVSALNQSGDDAKKKTAIQNQ
jgi:hypothetical protein